MSPNDENTPLKLSPRCPIKSFREIFFFYLKFIVDLIMSAILDNDCSVF
jgi:hypothetical protein